MNRSLKNRGITLVELLAVVAIASLLLGMLLPAIQAARESGRRAQCINNLHQLAIAIASSETTHKCLPSGGWGKNWAGISSRGFGVAQPGGWIYQILPSIDQRALFELGGEGAGQSQANSDRLGVSLPLLHCPSRRGAQPYAVSNSWVPNLHNPVSLAARNDYAINGGSIYVRFSPGPESFDAARGYPWADMKDSSGLCYQRSRVRLGEVTDGLANTYLLGEKHLYRANYMSGSDAGDNESAYSGDDRDLIRYTGKPGDLSMRPGRDSEELPGFDGRGGVSFGSAHSSGFQVAFVDGSARLISYQIDQVIHSRLGSRNDGMLLDIDEF